MSSRPYRSMNELFLLRHGKTEPPSTADDLQRKLLPIGEADIMRLGTWFTDNNIAPDRIVTSPARRAQETAEIISQACGVAVELDNRIYEATAHDLQRIVADYPTPGRLLLVGHNPGIHLFAAQLAQDDGRESSRSFAMSPGGLAILDARHGLTPKACPLRYRAPRD